MAPHLRPHAARARRFPLGLPLRLRPCGASSWSHSITCNVSRTGVLLVDGDGALQPGADVDLVLTLANDAVSSADVSGTGRVVRRDRLQGQDVIAIAIDLADFPVDDAMVQGA